MRYFAYCSPGAATAAAWAFILHFCRLHNTTARPTATANVSLSGFSDNGKTNSIRNTAVCHLSSCDCRPAAGSAYDVNVRCRELPSVSAKTANRPQPFASLALVRINMTSFPVGAPFERMPTRVLDLTGNSFSKPGCCSERIFGGLERVLNVLLMAECSLNRIPVDAIRNLTELRVVRLDGNVISSVKRGTFKHNRKLTELSLARNTLTKLDPNSFEGLSNLRELVLSRNMIARLPGRIFSPLKNLFRLDLSENFIHQMSASTFRGPSRHLAWLKLQSNALHYVTRATFSGLRSLVSLGLERNPLVDIGKGAFDDLARLEHLSIDLPANLTVSPRSFRGLVALKTLSFNYIGLLTLPPRVFAPMSSLSYLSLGDAAESKGSGNGGLASTAGMKGKFSGLQLNHFRADMDFRLLSIWAGAIDQCRCSVEWIQTLVERGAAIQGSCGVQNQLVHCASKWVYNNSSSTPPANRSTKH